MICGTCKAEKPDNEFTKLNVSKDGSKGLCRICKKERDIKHSVIKKVNNQRLPFFELTPNLIKRTNARIGVLNLHKFSDRENTKGIPMVNMSNVGLNAILKELGESYEYCDAKQINDYEYILLSLTSVMDVENLIYTFEKYAPTDIRSKIIVGGFGVCNIKLITPYVDIAVFGRAEAQIREIIEGKRFDNVWRKTDDPHIENRYTIRQTQYLVDGEIGVGCRNHCRYCQYTHIRRQIHDNTIYNPGSKIASIESEWSALNATRAGRYTTAWDGWSDSTRKMVCKPVTDEAIVAKLIDLGNRDISGALNIKVFQIVGYPWETEKSVVDDMEKCKGIFRAVNDNIKNKIVLSFLNTPFGPEPITPMQYDAANIETSWRVVVRPDEYYVGKKVMAHIVPFITGSFTLLKRVFIHRAEVEDLDLFKNIAFSSKLRRMPDTDKIKWLLKYRVIDAKMFGKIESAAFDYLIPPGSIIK